MDRYDRPLVTPLGEAALVLTFSDRLTLEANSRAIAAARAIERAGLAGVSEITSTLVSVYVAYRPEQVSFERLSGEIALVVETMAASEGEGRRLEIETRYGGPDLEAVAARLDLSPEAFVARHAERPLRVLAIGFAPGFAYCGLHANDLTLPRRDAVRRVGAGTILFAAGQTAVCATPIPTGWWVIGETAFRNFDPGATPPVTLEPGDTVRFAAAR